MTILDDFYGLIDLMLLEEERGRRFDIDGIGCEIEDRDGSAFFLAGDAEFAIAAVFPGWYQGGSTPYHVSVAVIGDYLALFQWLPISPDNKREIIARLPFDQVDRTILLLAV